MNILIHNENDENLSDSLTDERCSAPLVKTSPSLIKNMKENPFSCNKKVSKDDIFSFRCEVSQKNLALEHERPSMRAKDTEINLRPSAFLGK